LGWLGKLSATFSVALATFSVAKKRDGVCQKFRLGVRDGLYPQPHLWWLSHTCSCDSAVLCKHHTVDGICGDVHCLGV
jgi:hypothetical protein